MVLLAVVNLESVLKLEVMVMAPAQSKKKVRSSWGGGTLNRPRENLAEAGRGSCPCVCVIEDICFNRIEVFGTTLT